MRKFVNLWKMDIYPDDLKYVLINGILMTFFVGAFIGFLDALTYRSVQFTLILFILALGYIIGYRIAKSYFSYHILYATLAVVFTVMGFYISRVAFYVFLTGNLEILRLVSNPALHFGFLLFWKWRIVSVLGMFYYLLDVLIFVFMCWLAYKNASRHY